VAIVAGLRTPFMRSGTAYRRLGTLDLATATVTELLARSGLDGGDVDRVVFGAVVGDVTAPNIAREIVLGTALADTVDAYSVSRACATSTQAIVDATLAILHGEADVVVAGGADSLSRPPILYDETLVSALMAARAARDLPSRLKAVGGIRLRALVPRAPALADRSTGLTMGDAAEKMARENGITRRSQDEYALTSHQKAVEAWEKGIFDDEVMAFPLPPDYTETATRDNIPRPDTSMEKLAALAPAFDRRYGTVSAGNSSPLTDGAAAVVLMEERAAARHGMVPKAFVRSWAFGALDPGWQMLMGPAFAAPVALERAGLQLGDVDVIDMHEAFAAQVLSNLQAFSDPEWARRHRGRDEPFAEVPLDPAGHDFNPYGGSISLGHPFAATGARQALTMANELVRRDSGVALVTQCAAGGLGAALVLER
jgi:acetyl-CoA acyltransferase